MKFNFDKLTERRMSGSLKWDVPEEEIPLWVADMDFETAPAIIDAVKKRAEHGIFGYSILPEEWYEAYIQWWKKRHDFKIEKEWLIFTTGVVPAISTAVRKLTTPAEKVLILTPCYNIFFNSILNNGRVPVECPLAYDGVSYAIDWRLLEDYLSDPQVTLMIFCNPQNPIGMIWSRETLAKVGELSKKYHVTVLSDEIHCDLTEPGVEYVPFAAASEICKEISVTCVAPTKTFSIAGLQTAAVFAANENLRHKMWRALNTDEVAEPNAFAVDATIAAFEEGEEWLDALRNYLSENRRFATSYIQENIPDIYVIPQNATYLMWLDCRSFAGDSEVLQEYLRKEAGVYLSAGSVYGESGQGFMRLNIGCPKARLEEGLHRVKVGINQYIKKVF